MADPAAGTTSPESGAATVSKELSALVLQDDEDKIIATHAVQDSVSSLTEQPTATSDLATNGEKSDRRPLFNSMRAALESSGQVKEEPGGYVIKRRRSNNNNNNRQQQPFRSGESARRPKNRHAKQRASKGGNVRATAKPEDEADAAGYTVIRRRSSCDESSSASASASSNSARRNPRASTPSNNKKQQRPRRGSMSALQQSSSLAVAIAPSSSVPPGFQPHATSRVLRPPPGLTPAASGWVVKAAAPAENASKIAEPPVEALWPEMKVAVKTDSGWATTESLQAWPPAAEASSSSEDQKGEDDLLARLGVTL